MMGLVMLAQESVPIDPNSIGLGHVVALLAVVVAAVATPFLLRRRPGGNPSEVEKEVVHQGARVRAAADRALLELLEASREIHAQIDTKIRVLNRLVKDAEEESERLERLLGAASAKTARGGSPTPAAGDEAEVPRADGKSAVVGRLKRTASGRFVSDLHRRIERLHDEGLAANEIARRVRLSLQEVNLVLHMMQDPERG